MALRREGDRLHIAGPLGIENVRGVLLDVRAACADGVRIVDLAEVSTVDSAAVAFALELLREAQAAGWTLSFANPPHAMQELARLYSVSEILSGDRA
jgi:ABC-type transporter Mla MlaB component